jgi:hypothetical protein
MSEAAVVKVPGIPGREVILEGLTGPARGMRLEIADGTVASVGRTGKARFAVGGDSRMAETHFEVACAGAQVTIKDLDSGYGTHLNTRRIKQADLRHGDVISAGYSTFRARIHTPETWPDITPAEYALVALLYGGAERVYAVLDAARDDRLPAVLQAFDTEHLSLFEGQRAWHLRSVAPYIAHIPRGSRILRLLVREGWGKSWGWYLTASVPMTGVRRHLQNFVSFQDPYGRPYFYRFWDPRVLRGALASASPADRARFFGPVSRYVAEGENPATAHDFRSSPAGPGNLVPLGP